MGNLFQITDPRGIVITCSKERWDEHIVFSKRIMRGNEQAVMNTVSYPDVIYASDEHSTRDVYFKKDSGATYSSELFTKAVVEICGNKGEVITAFPKEHIAGNIDREDIKYVKPRL